MLTRVANQLEIGDTLDHYRLDAEVSRTGMSTLYRATDLRTGQKVAVKLPHAEMDSDPVLLERFKREEEIGQQIDHPGVVKTYDGEERSRLYMVIEWVDGRMKAASCRSSGPWRLQWQYATRSITCTSMAWCIAT
jgi:serine/threonine protein kinase